MFKSLCCYTSRSSVLKYKFDGNFNYRLLIILLFRKIPTCSQGGGHSHLALPFLSTRQSSPGPQDRLLHGLFPICKKSNYSIKDTVLKDYKEE